MWRNWICSIAEPAVFCWFVHFVSKDSFLLRFQVIGCLQPDHLLDSPICQLCAIDPFWVVGQSYNSYCEPRQSSAHHCVLILVFPQCPSAFDPSNRNGWHSYSARIRLWDWIQKMMNFPLVSPRNLMKVVIFNPTLLWWLFLMTLESLTYFIRVHKKLNQHIL